MSVFCSDMLALLSAGPLHGLQSALCMPMMRSLSQSAVPCRYGAASIQLSACLSGWKQPGNMVLGVVQQISGEQTGKADNTSTPSVEAAPPTSCAAAWRGCSAFTAGAAAASMATCTSLNHASSTPPKNCCRVNRDTARHTHTTSISGSRQRTHMHKDTSSKRDNLTLSYCNLYLPAALSPSPIQWRLAVQTIPIKLCDLKHDTSHMTH